MEADSGWLSSRSVKTKRKRQSLEDIDDPHQDGSAEDEILSQDVVTKRPPLPKSAAHANGTPHSDMKKKRKRPRLDASSPTASTVLVPDSQETAAFPVSSAPNGQSIPHPPRVEDLDNGHVADHPEDGGNGAQRVRSALARDECHELLYFIEHNYLSSLSALMHSFKDLLFLGPDVNRSPLDDDQFERFMAEYRRLRGEKARVLAEASKRPTTRKRTPGAEKKLTAFHLFRRECIAQLREERSDLPASEIGKTVSAQWTQLSPAEKMPYRLKAAKLKEEQQAAGGEEGTAPKRAVTAWQVYFGEQQVERKTLGLSRQELGRAIADDWKKLSDEEREKYALIAEERAQQPATPRASRKRTTSTSSGGRKGRPASHATSGEIGEDEGPVVVRSKRLSNEAFLKITQIPNTVLVDTTLKSMSPYRKFAYAYPVGGIPIPLGRKEGYSMSVEGLFEGLKVFANAGVDRSTFANQSMKSLHRTEKKNGQLLGWSNGIKGHSDGDELLDAESARWKILFPAYKYVLEECLQQEVQELRNMLEQGKRLVLLDGEISVNPYDYSRPVAASELLRRFLLDQWPSREEERRLKETPLAKQRKDNLKEAERAPENRDRLQVHWDSQLSIGEEHESDEQQEETHEEEEEEEEEDEIEEDEEEDSEIDEISEEEESEGSEEEEDSS